MGLSISHQIITEKHRGQLHCRVEGDRVMFVIEIPLRQAIASPPATTNPQIIDESVR